MSIADAGTLTRLLENIINNPDDDQARLIYADALEESGDLKRARFIRLQCLMCRLSIRSSEWRALKRQLDELETAKNLTEWAEPVFQAVPSLPRSSVYVRFRQGLVEGISVSAEQFLRYADAISRVTPLRGVTLDGCRSHLDALVACPHLARIEELTVRERRPLNSGELGQLLSSPYLHSLRMVNISSNGSGDDIARVIAGPVHLQQLRSLLLAEDEMTDSGVIALAQCPRMASLKVLNLGGNFITDAGAEALIASPYLRNLRELCLDRFHWGLVGALDHEREVLNPISLSCQDRLRRHFSECYCSFSKGPESAIVESTS